MVDVDGGEADTDTDTGTVHAGDLNVRRWHIASSRCAAEICRYRGIAEIDQAAPIKLDL
jgi:hypothetical protein